MKKILFIFLLLCGLKGFSQSPYDPHWVSYIIGYEDLNVLTDDSLATYEIVTLSRCSQIHAARTLVTTPFTGTSITSCRVDLVFVNDDHIEVATNTFNTTLTGDTPESTAIGCYSSADGIVAIANVTTHGETVSQLTGGTILVWLLISQLPDCPEP